MTSFFSFIKSWWRESATTKKLVVCSGVLVGLIAAVWALGRTVQHWLPGVALAALLFLAAKGKCTEVQQRQEYCRQQFLINSRQNVLNFIQWLFAKQQRDRMGIHAVPLTSSLAYLNQHTTSEYTQEGLVHTVTVGLAEFNTASLYLLWESLTEPMNEALTEYCRLHNSNHSDKLMQFQVVSAIITDGAIRPEIILKILDCESCGKN